MNGSDPLLPAAAGYFQIIDYDWRRAVDNGPDDLDVPAWVSRGRPASESAIRARGIVEEAFRSVTAYQAGQEAFYLGNRKDEAMALVLMAALRDWQNNQTYGDRVRWLAHILARHRTLP